MHTDNAIKILLFLVVILLLVNLLTGTVGSYPAQAGPEPSGRGKYQISSWSCSIGTYGHHKGFYVVDTTTGKVVDSVDEVHEITSDIQKQTDKLTPKNGSVR